MVADFLAGQVRGVAMALGLAIEDERAAYLAAKATPAALRKDDGGLPEDAIVGRILRRLSLQGWAALVPDAETILVRVLDDGGAAAAKQLGILAGDLPAITDQVHLEAVHWARTRAAELVGMKWDGDTLVPNPDARWAITESTRESLRGAVVEALETGESTADLAERLEEHHAFSEARANTIARTEVAKADVAGNVATYRASGEVDGKRWLIGSEGSCDVCEGAAKLGVVPLDDDFGGVGDPPGHPNCVCDVIPVLAELDAEGDEPKD